MEAYHEIKTEEDIAYFKEVLTACMTGTCKRLNFWTTAESREMITYIREIMKDGSYVIAESMLWRILHAPDL